MDTGIRRQLVTFHALQQADPVHPGPACLLFGVTSRSQGNAG